MELFLKDLQLGKCQTIKLRGIFYEKMTEEELELMEKDSDYIESLCVHDDILMKMLSSDLLKVKEISNILKNFEHIEALCWRETFRIKLIITKH